MRSYARCLFELRLNSTAQFLKLVGSVSFDFWEADHRGFQSVTFEATVDEIAEADTILLSILEAYSHRAPVTARVGSISGNLFCADKVIAHLRLLAPSSAGRANITRQVLASLFPPSTVETAELQAISPLSEILPRARIGRVDPSVAFAGIDEFALAMLDFFFVPLLAEGGKTVAPPLRNTPSFLTTRSQCDDHAASPSRLESLRDLLLEREAGLCVVTGWMDMGVNKRRVLAGLRSSTTAVVEAAHILPHSLNSSQGHLSDEKAFVWRVLDMFDPGVRLKLIDHPRNALLVQSELHVLFGRLEWWLEAVPGELNTYTPHVSRRCTHHLSSQLVPEKRVVFLARGGVEVPDPRLINLHAACAKILEMSGAAEYVENLFWDAKMLEQKCTLDSDGSSNLYALLCSEGLGIIVK
ncbi:hypothetical protein K440DRAFT_665264 [Wilcoxina mikolae CBS 423.85]|nr:hypothetical protein K440DRAFT_665264 [Wilcoxina mikolae CBS 423.85]